MATDSKAVVLGLNETLVLAALPALGYWVAYVYQLGYCNYFDIPLEFIDISIVNVLVAVVGTAFVFGALHLAIDPVVMMSRLLSRQLRFSVLKMLVIGLLLSGSVLISKVSKGATLILVAFYAFLLCLEFILPLWTQRKVTGYANKLAAQRRVEDRTNSTMDFIGKVLGVKGMMTFAVVYLLSLLTYLGGGFAAKYKSDFMVVGYTTKSVVVKSVGDMFVVARFDAKAQTLSPLFSLISRKDDLEFTNERIGPLQPLGTKRH